MNAPNCTKVCCVFELVHFQSRQVFAQNRASTENVYSVLKCECATSHRSETQDGKGARDKEKDSEREQEQRQVRSAPKREKEKTNCVPFFLCCEADFFFISHIDYTVRCYN